MDACSRDTRPVRRVLALSAFVLLAAACGGSGGGALPDAAATQCGLPSPVGELDPSVVPDEFVVEGAELISTERNKDGFIAGLIVPAEVGRALDLYTAAAREAGFKIISADNEGFEAELYLKKGRQLGAVQIRQTLCRGVTLAFINILERAAPV